MPNMAGLFLFLLFYGTKAGFNIGAWWLLIGGPFLWLSAKKITHSSPPVSTALFASFWPPVLTFCIGIVIGFRFDWWDLMAVFVEEDPFEIRIGNLLAMVLWFLLSWWYCLSVVDASEPARSRHGKAIQLALLQVTIAEATIWAYSYVMAAQQT